MRELARTAHGQGPHHVYLVGGATAVLAGWRESSIDADLFTEHDDVLHDIQGIKERLAVNVELVRPEHFVPALHGSDDRHVFIDSIGPVHFHHYDPYAQVFSKIVRGFARDCDDAAAFVRSGMVDPFRLRELIYAIPDGAYVRYPSLTPAAVGVALDAFVDAMT